jgi:nucleotide-binding universal stress UspA family protein
MHVDTAKAANDNPLGSRAQTSGRIVVGVDGSDSSVDALRWASGQSEVTGATVEAVTGWSYPTQAIMGPGTVGMDWAANAQALMNTALHQAFGDDHPNVRTVVVRGRPAQVLISAAQGADLLVVGSRGHGALAGMLLGSVSEDVAAHAPCPVVVIRHHSAPTPNTD